jgi:hypothetical protein
MCTILRLVRQLSFAPTHTVCFGPVRSPSPFLSPRNPVDGWVGGLRPVFQVGRRIVALRLGAPNESLAGGSALAAQVLDLFASSAKKAPGGGASGFWLPTE